MRLPALAAALALVVLVSGCVPQSPAPVPSPAEPSYTPLFASDEEALAAAEEAYREYQAMSNLIINEGGRNPERIAPFVTEEYYEVELDAFAYFSDSLLRGIGEATFDSIQLQQTYATGTETAVVAVYLCLDVSATQIVDAEGNTVTPERDVRGLFEVNFEATRGAPVTMLLSHSQLWQGEDTC